MSLPCEHIVMTDGSTSVKNGLYDQLFSTYANANSELLTQLEKIIAPNANRLAEYFYTNVLKIRESRFYLNHEVVSERLHQSMSAWIRSLFLPRDKQSVIEHIQRQRLVGEVHARINVPMRLVNHGMRLLKSEMSRLILVSDLAAPHKSSALILLNDILDYSLALINETYVDQHVSNENESQSLRKHWISVSLVIELERLRSSLFDWLRQTIVATYNRYPDDYPILSSVYLSDFGLWVTYKAEILFEENHDLIGKLHVQLRQIQASIERLCQLKGADSKAALSSAMESLNKAVSHAAWLLGDVASQTHEMDAGQDPLTRLFNRRFLPVVMQSMIKTSKTSGTDFSILSFDMDGFKQINDQYGHEVGDSAIKAFGEFLTSHVRATDFVFRLGGDEFLMILAGADTKTGENIARKILSELEEKRFTLSNDVTVLLGTSIGIVGHDGHPDYLLMLKKADEALYKAKLLEEKYYINLLQTPSESSKTELQISLS